jgi:hypothetical protein
MTDEERDATINTLVDAIAATNRNVNLLTADVAGLTRVMRLHLVQDHGYEDPDDEE